MRVPLSRAFRAIRWQSTTIFAAKHGLTVPLLADIDGAVNRSLWRLGREKTCMAKKSMGIERATYLIDANGNIARHLAQG